MTFRARAAVLGAFVVLLIVGTFFEDENTRPMSATTFGTVPGGYGAVYDLLTELGLAVGRSYVLPTAPGPPATRWWLEARGACREPTWPPLSWVEAGGAAVLLFGGTGSEPCQLSADVRVPARVAVDAACAGPHQVAGDLGPRTLDVAGLAAFVDAGDWTVRARVGERPFVLERRLGDGVVVVVADAGFLSNASLDRADAAPLAVDLVRAYGVPVFDEHELGPVAGGGTLAYLARSPALGVFLGLALTGVLFAWQGALVPARQVEERDLGAPRLDAFVDAVAALYARSGDHARVLARYRTLTVRRLQRRFGLAADAPAAAVRARLRRHVPTDPAAVELLFAEDGAVSEAGLRDAACALDRLARGVGA
jgi:uncharacterized protein DUF4350